MTLNIRLYAPSDYEMVCGWWKSWGWDCLPETSLPRVGAIVSDDNKDICAAWLYQTDSDLALVEWFISSKDARENRKEAKALLIEFLCDVARKSGFRTVISLAQNPHLLRSLRAAGFEGKEEITFSVARNLDA